MREEISEPQHWRSHTGNDSWSARRRIAAHATGTIASLPAEVVDAAFADESSSVEPIRGSRRDLATPNGVELASVAGQDTSVSCPDLVQSLSTQLDMLEAQRAQLQRLLDQAQDGQD